MIIVFQNNSQMKKSVPYWLLWISYCTLWLRSNFRLMKESKCWNRFWKNIVCRDLHTAFSFSPKKRLAVWQISCWEHSLDIIVYMNIHSNLRLTWFWWLCHQTEDNKKINLSKRAFMKPMPWMTASAVLIWKEQDWHLLSLVIELTSQAQWKVNLMWSWTKINHLLNPALLTKIKHLRRLWVKFNQSIGIKLVKFTNQRVPSNISFQKKWVVLEKVPRCKLINRTLRMKKNMEKVKRNEYIHINLLYKIIKNYIFIF